MPRFIGSDTMLQDAARASSLLHASTGQRRTRVPLRAQQQPKPHTMLTVGQKVRGYVNRCSETGAFLDLEEGQRGFLHVSKMSQECAEMTESMVLVGRELTVWVQDIRSTGKVMLTCREPGGLAKLEKGQELEGEVMGFIENGAFVDVGVDRDGFVHKSKMSYDSVERPDEVFRVGHKVQVWVEEIHPDGKLELTCRRPVDLSGFVGISENIWLPGTVEALNWFSMRILVEPPSIGSPALGIVPKEELSDSGDENPNKMASVGDYVRVRVTKVDREKGLLLLSLRA